MSDQPMENGNMSEKERFLDELFLAYREALPDQDPSAAFMPALWARIDERERSTNWFGRVAKMLTMAAVAASLVLAMLVSSSNQTPVFFNGNFIDALSDDHVAALEPLHLDRISQLERQ